MGRKSQAAMGPYFSATTPQRPIAFLEVCYTIQKEPKHCKTNINAEFQRGF